MWRSVLVKRRENTLQWATTRLDTQKNRSATLKSLALRLIWLLYKSRYFYFALINHIDWGGEADQNIAWYTISFVYLETVPLVSPCQKLLVALKREVAPYIQERSPASVSTLILTLTKKFLFSYFSFIVHAKTRRDALFTKPRTAVTILENPWKARWNNFQLTF